MVSFSIRIVPVVLLLIGLATGVGRADTGEVNAGVRMIEVEDPVSHKPMKAAVFYPTLDGAETTRLGLLEIGAKKDATVSLGRHPVILLSHGNGGGMFSHHDTAEFLARHGYLVAAIEHPGDNFRDDSGLGSDRVLVGRNLQLSALLDGLLRGSTAESVDATRVGVAGFSAGGYTALTMVGAQPRFELLRPFCGQHPESVLCAGGGTIRLSSPPLAAKVDARVRAAFVMSPVAAFFDRHGLSSVAMPVWLYAAGADAVLPPDDNARRIRSEIPALAGYTEIPEAGHFVFLAPCSPKMQSATPALCLDKPGIDRRAVHEELNGEMLRFFNGHLQPE